jgi:hypothetical protein
MVRPKAQARQRSGPVSRGLGKNNASAKPLRTICSLALPIEDEDDDEYEDDSKLTY